MINNREIKLSVFADDSNFFVISTESVILLLTSGISSLKLNLEITEACWSGCAKGRLNKPVNCNWIDLTANKIRILGAYYGYDTDLVNRHNFFDIP